MSIQAVGAVSAGSAFFTWTVGFPKRSLETVGWQALSEIAVTLGRLEFALILAGHWVEPPAICGFPSTTPTVCRLSFCSLGLDWGSLDWPFC
jgi:hypothetical protein